MKKREQVKRKDNLIFFPGLDERLTDKGLESLEQKKYTEAISLLEQARELDPDNDNVLIGLVLAYFEAGSYKKAKELANEMMLKGIGDYFQLVDLYLTVLIQLHEYKEIVTTIEALFEEKEIPTEKQDHFLTILQFSRRMADNHQAEEEGPVVEERELQLFAQTNLNEQMRLIAGLGQKNIRPYLNEITEYLKDETGHPFLKTMLLTLLKEQEVEIELIIRKFSKELAINPVTLPEVRQQTIMEEVKHLLSDHLENQNPGLFENIIGMVERTFFITYPFQLEPVSAAAWAAAFHILAVEYFGMELNFSELAEEYDVPTQEITAAREWIESLEKISYPNI